MCFCFLNNSMFSVLVLIRELVQLTSNEENAIQLYDFYDLRTFKRNIIKAEIITMYNSMKSQGTYKQNTPQLVCALNNKVIAKVMWLWHNCCW